MSAENLLGLWKDVRAGLIREVERVPADQFSFKATDQTRSVAELVQHIVEAQKFLVGETCRADTNLMRQSFADHTKEYAGGVREVADKAGLLDLLQTSMDQAEAAINLFSNQLDETMVRFDGRQTSKIAFLTFAMSHEMYHRGQLTVYERLLNIEPVLTERLKKMFATAA